MTMTKNGRVIGWFTALILTFAAASSAHAQTGVYPVYGPWGVYYMPYYPSYPGPLYSQSVPASNGQAAPITRTSAKSGYAAASSNTDSRPSYYSEDYTGPEGPTNAPSKVAYIRVRVPANAELWMNKEKRTQTGTIREFVTPALNPDHIYVYNVRARWTEEGGISVEKTLRVRTISGTRVTVNFVRPPAEQPRQTVQTSVATAPSSARQVEQQPVNWTSGAAPRSFRGGAP
ncbi:MAG TPA: TIGR03000 domain-containing protein [Gemmataceae bacterium]|nr:TIGR03000 domain-containing protein [Gemmataceae bacterium]